MSAVNGTAAARLARRLRELREQEWADIGLTQAQLATALSEERRVASATLSSWENTNHPKAPTRARLHAYARFFASRRSLDGEPHLIAVDALEEDEHQRFLQLEHELFQLHAELDGPPPIDVVLDAERRQLLSFGAVGVVDPVVIVCPEAPEDSRGPLADESDPNHTRLHRFADADALLEIFGHIRALNPERQILYRLPYEVRNSDLTNHLVVIGGVGWNSTLADIQDQLATKLPIEQFADKRLATGEIFRIRREGAGEEWLISPKYVKVNGLDQLTEDVGLIARLVNPYNFSRTLTICNGVHSKGVHGAALSLTDETLRPGNERYLAARFPRGDLALMVRVRLVRGEAMAPDLQNPETRIFEWPPATAGE